MPAVTQNRRLHAIDPSQFAPDPLRWYRDTSGFIQLFTRVAGVRPKLYLRLQRFERLRKATRSAAINWADAVADRGYYDQSHLIRDFRQFTGMTSTAYSKPLVSPAIQKLAT